MLPNPRFSGAAKKASCDRQLAHFGPFLHESLPTLYLVNPAVEMTLELYVSQRRPPNF